ncbi:tRNA (adenosine(37)-N6)-threonylcarbamoyltransferase complex ATPase subunit type 1 TsaE [Aestuariivivens sediminis]|uniref:tRNA (adenosine(37)-N6)-threonylcarbamoyltransferase complex ATPase subunit type 1 TsaE n=1 Tax=Aestuariivivens sediminis TaxID=2913557 RepID=UPI001F5A6DE4|nr:tRNA (adenosine(37)-N6)-threonylcarbamoyltransferase complex ATPase subunit type 1 TsaE [Aestuariivivens sediminis]
MEIVYDLNEVDDVGKWLRANVSSKILLFKGEMGAGKTTLIKSFVKALESDDEVSSPTFSIVNEYESRQGTIYHFDLYRIEDIEEVYNFGIEDYLNSDSWILIEWPELIKEMIFEKFDEIMVTIKGNSSRNLKLNYC